MPKCCGVESEKRYYKNGGIGYYCYKCKTEYCPAEGLGFLSQPTTMVTTKRVKRRMKGN